MGCAHARVWQVVAIEPIAAGVQSYRVSHHDRQFRGKYNGLPKVAKLIKRARESSSDFLASKAKIYHRITPECPADDLPDEKLLVKLGRAMMPPDPIRLPIRPDAVDIPAAYTYFGQLIAHDLNNLNVISDGGVTKASNSKLDLSSLFWPKLDDIAFAEGSHVEAGVAIGRVMRGVTSSYDDLPRNEDGLSLIPDHRNDANLAIAQLCVAISKFHQLLARENPTLDIESVRGLTVKQIQAIALFDFLPRIIDPQVYCDVMNRGRGLLKSVRDSFRVPIEFSSACYRFGHSLVRDQYRWNDEEKQTTTRSLLKQTHVGGAIIKETRGTLGARWITDWDNLLPVLTKNGYDNASTIDLGMAYHLFELDEKWIKNPYSSRQFINLAAQTLIRGRDYRLADAQTIIDHINRQLEPGHAEIEPLSESKIKDIADDSVCDAVVNSGFHASTPLWFYVLREASIFHAGQRLGPLGSRIVMETIHAAIEASASGIIIDNNLVISREQIGQITLADLIKKTQVWAPDV